MPDGPSEYDSFLLPGFKAEAPRGADEMCCYRAGLALPVGAPPIVDPLLVTRGEAIVAIGEAKSLLAEYADAHRVVEMPGAVLLPGLVNAHCHLSLSFAEGLLPPTENFVAWIRKLLPLRGTWTEREFQLSILAGLRETLRGGCAAIGEIVTEAASWQTLADARAPLRLRAYREYFGWTGEDRERRAEEAAAFVADIDGPESDGLFPGLSPHAPYTTPPELYQTLIDLANKAKLPLSTHVAETRAETEFIATGGGDFGDIHEHLGWRQEPFAWKGVGTLAAWLAARDISVPLQIVHGTHLGDEDIAALARLNCTVVYCPGSVAHFHGGRDPHPVVRLLAAGIPVALGTDSLASSPTLNMPLTCTLAARAHPELEPETILEMATRAGSASLGFSGAGTLRAGGRADFLFFDLGSALPKRGDVETRGREAVAGALLDGYRVPGLHVFGGIPYAFAGLRPHPA
jgi:cytosine/adenosine deaminase-related metal-dependent hydrolase